MNEPEEVTKVFEISQKSVKEVVEVEKNPSNKVSLDNVIEAAKAIPQNKAEVEEKIRSFALSKIAYQLKAI